MLTTFVLAIALLDFWAGEFGTTQQYPLLTVAIVAVSVFATFTLVKGSADGYDSMRGRLPRVARVALIAHAVFSLLHFLSLDLVGQRIPFDFPYILLIAATQGALAVCGERRLFLLTRTLGQFESDS